MADFQLPLPAGPVIPIPADMEIAAADLKVALDMAGYPVTFTSGANTLSVFGSTVEAPNVIRFAVVATRGGVQLPGWDTDQIFVNPRRYYFNGTQYVSDPVGAVFRALLGQAQPGPT